MFDTEGFKKGLQAQEKTLKESLMGEEPIDGLENFNPFNKTFLAMNEQEKAHIKTVSDMRREQMKRSNPYFAFLNVLGPQQNFGTPQRFGTAPKPPGVQL